MAIKLTTKSQEALAESAGTAQAAGHAQIEPAHMLAGEVREGERVHVDREEAGSGLVLESVQRGASEAQ